VSGFVTASLASVAAATPRSQLVALDLRGTPFSFLPGQAVFIGEHGHAVRRPYSIASSPEQSADTGRLELLIGTDEDGSIGPHLTSLALGMLIDVQGPIGTFTFPPSLEHPRVLFVAGGTGIAPLRSMLDHVLRTHPAEQLSLLYSARRADDFAFIEELIQHAQRGRLELHQTITRDDDAWEGRRGRIGRTHFEAVLHDRLQTLCFICGPDSLVSEAVATLVDLGVPRESIRTEEWSLTRDS
jgi:NAD(P)H-flavin reductase